jgi:hypothetical protein
MEQTAGGTIPIDVSETEEKNSSSAEGVPNGKETTQEAALYVATNLESWGTLTPKYYARDVSVDDTCYRRLDPDYYAWLRHKMALAKKAVDSGRISSSAFDKLRTRFNDIHTWAVGRLGEDTLRTAIQSLDPKAYSPPVLETFDQGIQCPLRHITPEERPLPGSLFLYPKDGEWQFTQEVSSQAIAKVDAIRDQALSIGWSEARLYQNRGCLRFPYGQDYGLVCFVDGDVRIGEVTRQSIEIVGTTSQANRLRFYNPDVDQPWLRRIRNEE